MQFIQDDFTGAPFNCRCTLKSTKIKLMKRYSIDYELKNLLTTNNCFESLPYSS